MLSTLDFITVLGSINIAAGAGRLLCFPQFNAHRKRGYGDSNGSIKTGTTSHCRSRRNPLEISTCSVWNRTSRDTESNKVPPRSPCGVCSVQLGSVSRYHRVFPGFLLPLPKQAVTSAGSLVQQSSTATIDHRRLQSQLKIGSFTFRRFFSSIQRDCTQAIAYVLPEFHPMGRGRLVGVLWTFCRSHERKWNLKFFLQVHGERHEGLAEFPPPVSEPGFSGRFQDDWLTWWARRCAHSPSRTGSRAATPPSPAPAAGARRRNHRPPFLLRRRGLALFVRRGRYAPQRTHTHTANLTHTHTQTSPNTLRKTHTHTQTHTEAHARKSSAKDDGFLLLPSVLLLVLRRRQRVVLSVEMERSVDEAVLRT